MAEKSSQTHRSQVAYPRLEGTLIEDFKKYTFVDNGECTWCHKAGKIRRASTNQGFMNLCEPCIRRAITEQAR
jgi:hypothetical protein